MAECGTVEVLAAFDESAVELSQCGLSSNTITAGGTVTATVSVRNNNSNVPARVTVNFSTSAASASDVVTVQAGRTETARVDFEFATPGSYTVESAIGNVSQA